MLRKGVYYYEYMDEWEKFNETSLSKKDDFYSNLDMERCRLHACTIEIKRFGSMSWFVSSKRYIAIGR